MKSSSWLQNCPDFPDLKQKPPFLKIVLYLSPPVTVQLGNDTSYEKPGTIKYLKIE